MVCGDDSSCDNAVPAGVKWLEEVVGQQSTTFDGEAAHTKHS